MTEQAKVYTSYHNGIMRKQAYALGETITITYNEYGSPWMIEPLLLQEKLFRIVEVLPISAHERRELVMLIDYSIK